MATQSERIAVLETKVDELKETVKTNDQELKAELKKMYEASCTQHARLSEDLAALKSFRDSWLARIATAGVILGPIAGFLLTKVDWVAFLK